MLRVSGATGLVALVLLGAGEAPAQGPSPAALGRLEAGLWEFKPLGRTGTSSRICITDLRQLLQPQQPSIVCRQFIAENGGEQTAVAYECAAQGRGRTTLRVETPRLVQIDSQGVADGRPFSVRYEVRRLGACSTALR